MILRRRGRFGALVDSQLDLFEDDYAELLGEQHEAEEAWNRAVRDQAEEAYGDLQLVLDTVGDRLLDIREAYAATLPEERVGEYRAAFGRAAKRRFGHGASLLAEERG